MKDFQLHIQNDEQSKKMKIEVPAYCQAIYIDVDNLEDIIANIKDFFINFIGVDD